MLHQAWQVSVPPTQGAYKEDQMHGAVPQLDIERSRTISDATDDDVFHEVSTGETPRPGSNTLQDPLLSI